MFDRLETVRYCARWVLYGCRAEAFSTRPYKESASGAAELFYAVAVCIKIDSMYRIATPAAHPVGWLTVWSASFILPPEGNEQT